MRLTDFEIDAIRSAAVQTFGSAVSVWLFGSRVDDSKRGGDIDLLIIAESDQTRLAILKRETDFLVALKQLIGEQKIDLVVATSGSLVSDPFLRTLASRVPLTGTHAIKITFELIETCRGFLKTHSLARDASLLDNYLIYSDGRAVAFVEVGQTNDAGASVTAVLTQLADQAEHFKSLVFSELSKK